MFNTKNSILFLAMTISANASAYDLNKFAKICEYSKLPKLERYQLYNAAFNSLIPARDRKIISNGLSNYIVFLKDSKKHFDKECKQDASTPSCMSIKRRAKTYYEYDVNSGLNRIESYLTEYGPMISAALSHCGNASEELNEAFDSLKKDLDVTPEISANKFDDAIFSLSTVAGLLDMKIADSRVQNPVLKNSILSKDSNRRNITSNICFDKNDSASEEATSISSFISDMKSKVVSFFGPKKPKTLTAK